MRLNFFGKIVTAPLVGMLALALFYVFVHRVTEKDERLVELIDAGYFPASELMHDLRETLVLTQREFQAAVAIGDVAILGEVDSLRQRWLDRLRSQAQNPTLGPTQVRDLERDFEAYCRLSMLTMRSLIQEPSAGIELTASLEDVRSRYAALLETLDDSLLQARERIGEAFRAVHSGHRRSMLLTGGLFASLAALLTALSVAITRSLTGTVGKLVRATAELSSGATPRPLGRLSNDELGDLALSFDRMVESLRASEEHLLAQMEELRRTQRELVRAEKLSSLGTLSGGVAHDFNNILCAILGHTQLLRATGTTGDVDSSLRTIEQASLRGAALTSKLLTFSHHSPEKLESLELNECVRQVCELISRTLDKRIEVILDLAQPSPVIHGDPGEIEQVLMNFCVNARDAMSEGGRITVRTDTVTLEEPFCADNKLAWPGAYAHLTVEDTGSGIPAALLPQIFEPFFTTKKLDQGTGLGLSIVEKILRSHGGVCQVESTVGKGTRFDVYLPLGEPMAGGLRTAQDQPAAIDRAERTVLIVDDEEMICSFLGRCLKRQGFTTRVVHNGSEALSVLEQELDPIDLVILDLNMPVLGGAEVLERLSDLRPSLPVIAISGVHIEERVTDLLRRCAGAAMLKPFGAEDIVNKVREVLGGS